MNSDRSNTLAEIEERLNMAINMNRMMAPDQESMSDWYERDVGWLFGEVKRLSGDTGAAETTCETKSCDMPERR